MSVHKVRAQRSVRPHAEGQEARQYRVITSTVSMGETYERVAGIIYGAWTREYAESVADSQYGSLPGSKFVRIEVMP